MAQAQIFHGKRSIVMNRYLLPLVMLLGLLVFCGVRRADTTLAISRSAAEDPVTVQMLDSTFELRTVTVSIGTTLSWTNDGQIVHTATADNGSFDTGDVAPGATSTSVTFDQPGTYPYFCRYHGSPGGRGMAGTIVVTGQVVTGQMVFCRLSSARAPAVQSFRGQESAHAEAQGRNETER